MPKPRNVLSSRQRRFLEEYLVDFNGAGAWRRAFGGTPRYANQQSSQTLSKPAVSAAVDAALDERAAETRAEEARVLAELRLVAFSRMRQVADWGHRDGKPFLEVKDASALEEADAAAVAEVTQTSFGLRIKLHDKQAALLALARRLDIIAERLAAGGAGASAPALEAPVPTAAELARELRTLPREGRDAIRAVLLQHQIIDVTPTVKEEKS